MRENALVRHVVNRKDRARIFVEWVVTIHGLHIRRNQPRRPIVAVNDIGSPTEALQHFENPTAEENETNIVVRIVLLGIRVYVEALPAEELLDFRLAG